ncbi:MAG: dihydrolipoyl dehydrogenase [Candidatus Cloacimonetes bacterium]|nr:dihydrolipoyl dehydrogenase [Candidatus Cloacimonadota bacterium]
MIDVAIIGGGPGGYTTAIRLHQLGFAPVVFERERLGGTCLNRGCIPTKTLVRSAEVFTLIKNAADYGLSADNPGIDFGAIYARKDKVIEQLVAGVEFIFRKRGIEVINRKVTGLSRNGDGWSIEMGDDSHQARTVVLATGSRPTPLPFMRFDGKRVLSSSGILRLRSLPASLAVIGGGVIGCEFAAIFAALGTKVTIIEFLPRLVSTEDEEISKRLATALKKSGVKVHLKAGVESAEHTDDGVILSLSNGKSVEAQKALLSVGRGAHLGFEVEGLTMDRSAVMVDDDMRANLPGLYAVGDLTGRMMLAHVASAQGLRLAEVLRALRDGDQPATPPLAYENIPRCTFTHPEIGSVGLTETQARERHGDGVRVGKFQFNANGKALGLGEAFGFVKTIAAPDDTLVGMHILGPQATELIAEGAALVQSGMKAAETAHLVHAHPTLAESLLESIEDLHGMAVHKI